MPKSGRTFASSFLGSLLPRFAQAEVCDKMTILPPTEWPIPLDRMQWMAFGTVALVSLVILTAPVGRRRPAINLSAAALLALAAIVVWAPFLAERDSVLVAAMREGCVGYAGSPLGVVCVLLFAAAVHVAFAARFTKRRLADSRQLPGTGDAP